MTEGPHLALEGVAVELGGRAVLRGATARLPLTGLTAVVGRSGSGKSVLCRALVGLVPLAAGSVRLLGVRGFPPGTRLEALAPEARLRLRRAVPLVVQGAHLLDWRTVRDNVALAGPGDPDALLERVGLGGQGARLPGELGPGPQKLAALARALMLAPQALLLDEPTTGLDRAAAARVWEVLEALVREGVGVVAVSHELDALAHRAGQVIEVAGGELGYVGSAAGYAPLTPHG